MALTDQDRKDLLGMESRLGDTDCDNRAQELLKSNPDAAGYLRDVATLRSELEEAILPMYPPVPVAKAREITQKVLLDLESRATVAVPQSRRWHFAWSALGMAAAIAILLVPAGWLIRERMNRPTLVWVPGGGAVGADPLRGRTQERISLPYEIKARPAHAVLFKSGMVVAADDTVITLEKQDVVSFSRGVVYLRTPGSALVRFPDGQVQVEAAGVEVGIFEDYTRVFVSNGSCVVELAGKTHRLEAGQQLIRGLTDGQVSLRQREAKTPDWAEQVLIWAQK